MHALIFASLFITLNAASALACPDISGIYQLTDKVVLKLEQSDCTRLKKALATLKNDGSPLKWFAEQEFQLNGTPICNSRGACDSATAAVDGILFHSNYDGSVMTADHGRCSHNGYKANKDQNGNLSAQFHVYRCQDGFSGFSTKVFSKY